MKKLYTLNGVTYDKLPGMIQTAEGTVSPVSEAKFIEAGGVIEETDELSTEEKFNAACAYFRSICAAIGAKIGNANWQGGYDEIPEFDNSDFVTESPTEALLLSTRLKWADEQCKRLGGKLGYVDSQWWHKCWEAA